MSNASDLSLIDQTYNLIKELFLLVDHGDRLLLSRFRLTIPRFYALIHIAEHPGISPVKLSELMFCDKSNITRLLKGLEGEGSVVRVPHESDGRSVRLFLTQEGEQLIREASHEHQAFNQQRFEFLHKIPLERLQILLTVKSQLADNLESLKD